MNKLRKKKLLDLIETEMQRARTSAGRALTGAVKAQDGVITEVKKDSQGAGLAKKYLDKLQKLKEEISSLSEEENDVISLGTFVLVRYEDGSMLEICIVENPVSVPNFLFLSEETPLGKILLGKKEGDRFTYSPKGKKSKGFSGVVIRVE